MNPIEHVWDALERRVAGRQPPPQILQELERALLEEHKIRYERHNKEIKIATSCNYLTKTKSFQSSGYLYEAATGSLRIRVTFVDGVYDGWKDIVR
ncbi:hypothetical protein TNCV_1472791 [Trichonephila clavipes]|nr:hypothetical protein TNCV_1472791 [Trichonephila clavipes]